MKITNIILIISVLVALGVAYLAYDQGKNVTNEVAIPVLIKQVQPNTKITQDLIGTMNVDEKVLSDLPIITDPQQIVGRIALRSIYPNVPLIQNELVDEKAIRYDASQKNYFFSFDLADAGNAKLPYGFSAGKVNICMMIDDLGFMSIFGNGLPLSEKTRFQMTKVICPIRNLSLIGLTRDNTLPLTYITMDAASGKFVFPQEAVRLGIWMPNQDQIADVITILHRPMIGGASYKIFFTMPPYDTESDPDHGNLVIEKLFTEDPYAVFDILWKPEDLKKAGFIGGVSTAPTTNTTTDTGTTDAPTAENPTPAPTPAGQ